VSVGELMCSGLGSTDSLEYCTGHRSLRHLCFVDTVSTLDVRRVAYQVLNMHSHPHAAKIHFKKHWDFLWPRSLIGSR
jgi:hypothetical protein